MERIYRVCKDMMQHRGYKYEEIIPAPDHSFNAFKGFNETTSFCLFILRERLNSSLIKELTSTDEYHHLILVFESATHSVLKQITYFKFRVECFTWADLSYNILHHELVPRHVRISKEGHQEIDKYPKISTQDPVVKFLGFVEGDLLCIHRKNGTLYYRVVSQIS